MIALVVKYIWYAILFCLAFFVFLTIFITMFGQSHEWSMEREDV